MKRLFTSRNGYRPSTVTAVLLLVGAVVLGFLGGPLGGTSAGLSNYAVNAIGQLAAFAILAISIDLIWGYLGILSLGHGLFFAVGGYVAAMHLVKHTYEVTGKIPDFMQFMGWTEFPAFWAGLGSFPYALLVAVVVSAFIAFVFGATAFRSRVSGVYFAIITQALVYVIMLLMLRNNTGFGGNNGMTGFAVVLGWPIASRAVITGMAVGSIVILSLVLYLCGCFVSSRVGRLMLAVRDDEMRLSSLGYSSFRMKLAVWCLSAVIAAIAGFLYVPQFGIVSPRLLDPYLSIEFIVWVAIGGKGNLIGAVIGAILINLVKFWFSAAAPELWPFILAGLVVIVIFALPNGLTDLILRRTRRADKADGDGGALDDTRLASGEAQS